MLEFEAVERRVMQMLLAGDHPTLEVLRKQFDRCGVTKREFTGLGFFTSFKVPVDVPKLEPVRRIVLGDVCADVDGLGYGCGFILFVDDGLLATLECHLWGDDALPENARYTRFYYIHQRNPNRVTEANDRDMEAVNARLRI